MKKIPLSRGKFALVDDEDFDWLNQWRWFASSDKRHPDYFIARRNFTINGKRKGVSMHRLILGLTDSKIEVDHKDRNPLNNQRSNIRASTRSQNVTNVNPNGKSRFLGVSLRVFSMVHKNKKYHYKNWAVAIKTKEGRKYLGNLPFLPEGEILAALLYDEAARLYHKEFANLNFPNE